MTAPAPCLVRSSPRPIAAHRLTGSVIEVVPSALPGIDCVLMEVLVVWAKWIVLMLAARVVVFIALAAYGASPWSADTRALID